MKHVGSRSTLSYHWLAAFLFFVVLLSNLGLLAADQTAAQPLKGAASQADAIPARKGPYSSASVSLVKAYERLPLRFEVNRGQSDGRARFLARGPGYTLFLTSQGAVLALKHPSAKPSDSSALTMRLVGANAAPNFEGLEELPGRANYFIGSDPQKFVTGIRTYRKVSVGQIFPGVDLVYYGNPGQLEYDFVVAPRADASRIRFAFDATRLRAWIDAGNLVLRLPGGELRLQKPVAYQGDSAARRAVAARYVLEPGHQVRVALGRYNPALPVVIDPSLAYSTYLGGTGTDSGSAIAVDASGDAYVAGSTTSVDFPVVGPAQPTNAGLHDVFVAKLDPTGSSILYSTYLGGTGDDFGFGIAVDSSGSAYVTGQTNSGDFPITAGAAQTAAGGGEDAFVTKLSSDGSALMYSTYLGGAQDDSGNAIALDSTGEAFVAGNTTSRDFPVTASTAAQTANAGACDAFFTKVSSDGSSLLYSTYLGGTGADIAHAIAVDSSGAAYIAGETASTNFPVTGGVIQPASGGGKDAFAAKVDPSQSGAASLIYSTYVGGAGDDIALGIALDSTNNAYLTGQTASANFPATGGVLQSGLLGGTDAFVTKLGPTAAAYIYSTYLGGGGDDIGHAIAVDASTNAYVTGNTQSSEFPTVNPVQSQCAQTSGAGCDDAFVSKLSGNGSTLLYSTFLGGSLHDEGDALALDSSASAYVTGSTISTDFPTTPGVLQPSCTLSNGACADTFVAKLGPSALVNLSPSVLNFGLVDVGVPSASQTTTLTNNGTSALTITSLTTTGDFAVDSTGTTCSTTSTVGPTSTCTIALTFTPMARGIRTGTLTIADSASTSPQTVDLSGTGLGPVVSLSSTSLTFGDQTVGTSSAPQNVTLSNTGDGPLTITSVTITSGFTETNTCGSSVAAGASCTLSVTFSPSTAGVATGTLSINDDASGTPQTVALSGTGTSPISLSPSSLTFANQSVGTTSPAQNVTLTNGSSAAITITLIAITGTNTADFAQTNTCGPTLAVNASCTISVTFAPTAEGTRTASLSVTDNGLGSPQTVSLTGTGLEAFATPSPTSLTFANQSVGTTSPGQNVTVSNTGNTSLSITSITLTGTNPGDFSETNTCGASIAAGATCSITVAFAPKASGARTASVTLTDNGNGSPQSISLTGTGIQPAVTLSATSLTFAVQNVGTTSAAQTVTLTNSGTDTLTIQDISLPAAPGLSKADFAQTNNCASTLTPGNSCTFSVTFTPVTSGARAGTLTITDSAPGSPQSVALSGSGGDFTISATPATATIDAGGSATYTVSLSPAGGFASAVALACSGAPPLGSCSVSPASVTPGSSPTTATLTVQTKVNTMVTPLSRRLPPLAPSPSSWPWWEMAGALAFLVALGRRRRAMLTLAAMLMLVVVWASCGSRRITNPGTPAGTYTLTVTGTATGLAHSAQVTLVVNTLP